MAGPPPEDPTRRLTPVAPPGTPREVAYVEGDPETSRHALLGELRGLKRWLAVVGTIALASLGLSLYTLLAEEEDGGGGGASRTSVSRLEERVDELRDDVRDRATKNAVSGLREDQEALDGRVDEVAEQAGEGADGQAIDDLRTQLDELEERVAAAEQDAATGGEAAPDDAGATGTP